ncbi:MAG: ribonuclease HI, partial [Proteobacteria bacterium]|nr:ribonuclease HI [Pseudomonadota bacterium]
MEKKKNFYSVARGRKTGIFSAWFGAGGAEAQIKGFAGARYKGFPTIEEAREWLTSMESGSGSSSRKGGAKKNSTAEASAAFRAPVPEAGKVLMYTDGGCSYNPGPGGYGVVIFKGRQRLEFSGGFRLTTNNRMELAACIEGLKTLKTPSSITVCSDSKYLVDAVAKGWARKWQRNGWMRTKADAAENYDLWEQLLDLCDKHSVEFVWVKGHAGNKENECCDRLAVAAAAG